MSAGVCGGDSEPMTAAVAIGARPWLGTTPVVARPRLTNLLSSTSRLVVLVAPAGYGKTTLLRDWAAQDDRSFAWVSIGPADNDPACLEATIAIAAEQARPGNGDERLVLVLDDLQLLRSPAAYAPLAALLDSLPPTVTLAVSSRTLPRLPIARLRAERRILELGPAELAMDGGEIAELLRLAELEFGADEVAELWSRTEGWPAAAALGALSLGDRSEPAAATAFGGGDRDVADYLRDEVLRSLRADDRRLLLETAALDELCGPLCDHVLERTGSAAALSELAREQRMLIQLDRSDERFRHRRVVGEMLRAELQHGEPERAAELHRRACEWHAQEGDDGRGGPPCDRRRRRAARRRARVERRTGRGEPRSQGGRRGLAGAVPRPRSSPRRRRWRSRWRPPSWPRVRATSPSTGPAVAASAPLPLPAPVEAGVCLIRAALARDGLADMAEDAERAFALEPEASPSRAMSRPVRRHGRLARGRGGCGGAAPGRRPPRRRSRRPPSMRNA